MFINVLLNLPAASRLYWYDPAEYVSIPVCQDAKFSPCNHKLRTQSICHHIAHNVRPPNVPPKLLSKCPPQCPRRAKWHRGNRLPLCCKRKKLSFITVSIYCKNSISSTYLLPCRCIQRTVEVCPKSVWTHWPVSMSHTFRVRSVLPEIMMLPDIWDDQTPPV